jgi:DNA mismatch endonuclease (patch repair protein)
MGEIDLPKGTSVPSFSQFRPSSARASAAARASSKKANTVCEVQLKRALSRRGLRYRRNSKGLPGRPDIVFSSSRVAVFCDGDFWHGRNWSIRKPKLAAGSNAKYWLAKIERNRVRDKRQNRELRTLGWHVIRVWESDIKRDVNHVVSRISAALRRRSFTRVSD